MALFAIASAVAAVGAGLSGRKASKASARAAEARAKIAKLENARQRRQQIREQRIARGTAVSQAATRGGGPTGQLQNSAVSGVVGGLRTQAVSNLDFLDRASALNAEASRQEVRGARAAGNAALFNAVSAGASSFGTIFPDFNPFKKD